MSNEIDTVLERLVAAWRPSTLLVVAPKPGARAQALSRATGCRTTLFTAVRNPEALNELGRFDAGLVIDTLEKLDRRQGERLLARLRDLHTGCFAVVTPAPRAAGDDTHPWSRGELLSLGLHRECGCRSGGREYDVHVYDVRRYKRTPDWLNAENWANPELWDRYRW